MDKSSLNDIDELSGTEKPSTDYRLGQEIKILYELLPTSQWVYLLAAVILFAILFQSINQNILLRWFGFFLLVFSLRIILTINYRKSADVTAHVQFWYNMFLAGTALYGVMWSGTAIYLVPSESAVITGFTCLLLCALAAGSVAISSVNMKVFVVYAISTLWPYAALLIVSDIYPQTLFGWLMILFFIILIMMSVQVNRYFSKLISMELKARFLEDELRHENRKREIIEKALLDNTLAEELGEQIRRQAKSIRNELSKPAEINTDRYGNKEAKNIPLRQLVTYKPYLDKLNTTVLNQISSAMSFIDEFKNTHLTEEQQKRISIAEKLLRDVVMVIKKLDIDEGKDMRELDSLQIDKINIRQLLIYITHQIPLIYKSKFITVKRSIDNDIPKYVYGDRNILREVLQKLVLNSYQYSDGGIININIKTISEDENEIIIKFEVADTGVGIPKEVIDDFLNSKDINNEGSGLARIKRAVQALGGEIFAKSTLGVGSSIGFTLKLMKASDLLEA